MCINFYSVLKTCIQNFKNDSGQEMPNLQYKIRMDQDDVSIQTNLLYPQINFPGPGDEGNQVFLLLF